MLEELVQDHIYLRLLELANFPSVANAFTDCFSRDKGNYGYPLESCIKMLILQQAENISDRRMERYLRYDLGAKYFCGFNLTEATPDHSYFGKLRKRIGAEKIADLFNSVTQQLEKKGYDTNDFYEAARSKNLHNDVIKKNNRKDKDRDKDRWISSNT